MQAELAISIVAAAAVQTAASEADIICTITSAAEPILKGAWVRPGTHLNLVGSSYAGPSEVDNDLVVRSRFIADSREGVLNQGAEFLRAKKAGLIGDEHIVAEIGQVLSGEIAGRRSTDEITSINPSAMSFRTWPAPGRCIPSRPPPWLPDSLN
jgi:ornithine cyclodeaminase/alanine dehydrogenase-like protein (mu-crystallin family)